jgi:hypothetical protein
LTAIPNDRILMHILLLFLSQENTIRGLKVVVFIQLVLRQFAAGIRLTGVNTTLTTGFGIFTKTLLIDLRHIL